MPGTITFELAMPPEAASRAVRICGLRRVRAVTVSCVWHDTGERTLEGRGLALGEWRGRGVAGWRLERRWQAGPPLAEAVTPAGLEDIPDRLVPVGGFAGRMRAGMAGPVHAAVLTGTLSAGELSAPVCRVRLEGMVASVAALAAELAAVGAATCAPLAAALGGPAPARGAVPALPEEGTASDALAQVCGHLGLAIAAQAGPVAAGGVGPEPVHQMRVAVRRLRSMIKLFKSVAVGPELAGISAELRALGHLLGPARDWDVFLGGVGREVSAAFPDDAGMARLLAVAERRREEAYAVLRAELAGVSFRRLGIALALAALARPWEGAAGRLGLRAFAAAALARRRRRVLAPGRHIATLAPERLHALRLQAKRLRYAAELFVPLWDRQAAQRFIRRTTAVQEALGHLNDVTVAGELMARLGPAGRGRAGGIVVGFVAARAAQARKKIESSWRKLRKAEAFWT